MEPEHAEQGSAGRWHALSFCLTALAAWMVLSTHAVFSHTADEPMHVACGLEWYSQGTHVLNPENPPLAQLAIALGPHLLGLDFPTTGAPFWRGTEILYSGGNYRRNLEAARLGTLPFFLLACGLVWSWARRHGGARAACLALAAFVSLPPVLGHAGLATTDIASLSTFLLSLYALQRWLDRPSGSRAIQVGVALGVALATKYSVLVFLPPCLLALILLRRWLGASQAAEVDVLDAAPGHSLLRTLGSAGLALAASALMVWLFYRLSTGSMVDLPGAERTIQRAFPSEEGMGRRLAELAGAGWVPAPEFLMGLFSLYVHIAQGHDAYLLGSESLQGFWNFYPVVLGVKTPLTFGVIAVLGMLGLIGQRGLRLRHPGAAAVAPLVLSLAVLLAVLPSTINIGVRHVLVIYPLVAISSGIGLDRLMRGAPGAPRVLSKALVGLALLAQGLVVIRAHPDHLAYFNPLAGPEPGRVLLDSDLDWGQDIDQLAAVLEGREVELLHIATFGSARLCEHGLPPLEWLEPGREVTGWVAISEMYFRDHWHLAYSEACHRDRPTLSEVEQGYAWLAAYEPVARAGGSIRIYHIPER